MKSKRNRRRYWTALIKERTSCDALRCVEALGSLCTFPKGLLRRGWLPNLNKVGLHFFFFLLKDQSGNFPIPPLITADEVASNMLQEMTLSAPQI